MANSHRGFTEDIVEQIERIENISNQTYETIDVHLGIKMGDFSRSLFTKNGYNENSIITGVPLLDLKTGRILRSARNESLGGVEFSTLTNYLELDICILLPAQAGIANLGGVYFNEGGKPGDQMRNIPIVQVPKNLEGLSGKLMLS